MLSSLNSSPPVAVITSDASRSWGCGALCGIEWFQLRWNSYLEHSHISVKELAPIVIVAAVWGKNWFGQSLLVQSDNLVTVAMMNSGVSHNSEAMHLFRCLSFIAAKFQLSLAAVHIPGEKNTVADALSRNNLSLFYSLHPQACHHQTDVPDALVELLVGLRLDWTSSQWTSLWNNIFPQD